MQHLDQDVGSYRDDGLLVTNSSPRDVEKLKQEVAAIYQSQGFKITIEANKIEVNFLDLTLNLEKQTFKPYIKPGDVLFMSTTLQVSLKIYQLV